MTMPHEHNEGIITRHIDKALDEIDPIRVHLVADDTQSVDDAADFGSWGTFITDTRANLFKPIQVLRYSPTRKRAVIMVTPGLLANTAGFVALGSRNQINGAVTPGLAGGRMINGQTIALESKSELWLDGDGTNSLTVVVIDEQYRTDNPDS